MVKVQKLITFAATTFGILMLGVLAVSITTIQQQQATALVVSTNPNPYPQGSGQSQGLLVSPQANLIGSSNPQGSQQSTDEQQIQAQPPGRGCEFTPGGNASKGRCIH